MKPFLSDETATGNMSFVLPVVVIAFMYSCLLCVLLIGGVNVVLTIHNANVDSGMDSQLTADHMSTAKNLFMFDALLVFIGILMWGKIHQALESDYTDASVLIGGITGLYIATLTTMIMLLVVGNVLDISFDIFNTMDTHIGIANRTETGFVEAIDMIENGRTMSYWLCYVPYVSGLILFYLTISRRTAGQTYTDGELLTAGYGAD